MIIIMSINMAAAGFILLNYDSEEKEWYVLSLVDLDGMNDLPKGVIDKGENALKAAKRELFEETNIDINNDKIKKTWVNWDKEWEENKEESLDKISISSEKSRNLIMFFAEVDKSIIKDIKILPNPYTNKKEHLNYRLINIKLYESEHTPGYLYDYFKLVLDKIKSLGETRGFYD